MTVDGSMWFCKVGVDQSVTGFCDVMVKQADLESHLWQNHRIRETEPLGVIRHFLLARGSDHGKPPGRGKVDDQTPEMFVKGKDFR